MEEVCGIGRISKGRPPSVKGKMVNFLSVWKNKSYKMKASLVLGLI